MRCRPISPVISSPNLHRLIWASCLAFVTHCSRPASAVEFVPCAAPPGFEVIRAAGPPLVERPLFATFDDRGRLYVLDSGGVNGDDRGTKPPDVIRVLEDTDGDGVFDTSRVYADQIVFGTGLLWYDNAIFLTSPPSLWKLTDSDNDGVADQRQELVTGFAFNQSCSDDLHGACLGPDGRIYFLPGRFPHRVKLPDGTLLRAGVGPWLMRCRPDGSDMEFVSGCVGNPVEVDFLPSGEMFAQGTYWAKPTMGGGLRDAVVHVVDGGEYSVRDRDYTDRIRTGELLPALVPMSATAPSGCMIYRGTALGGQMRGDLFGSYFNTGKILRHRLRRQGATFSARTEDFLVPLTGDVHFTDVLEDADGTMLAIDTGGWFRRCCPTSQIAKPEILGGIYRVRRVGASTIGDPFGEALQVSISPDDEVIALLADLRPAVRERCTEELRRRSAISNAARTRIVDALSERLTKSVTLADHRNQIIWTLCRIDGSEARVANRPAIHDKDRDVRTAAIGAAALHRDAGAVADLQDILVNDQAFHVRREAANALGRIGDKRSVPILLETLAHTTPTRNVPQTSNRSQAVSQLTASLNGPDGFLDHALVLALIRIGDAEATRAGLRSTEVRVQRGAMIALDQMENGTLAADDVEQMAASPDSDLQRTAADILLRHPDWDQAAANLLRRWLESGTLTSEQHATLVQVVRQFRASALVRDVIGETLAAAVNARGAAVVSTDVSVSLLGVLQALRQSEIKDAPSSWTELLLSLTHQQDPVAGAELSEAALQAIEALQLSSAKDQLRPRLMSSDEPAARRVAIARVLLSLGETLAAEQLDYLRTQVSPQVPVNARLAAWDTIAAAKPIPAYLHELLEQREELTPVELPYLLKCFAETQDEATGLALVAALEKYELPIHPDTLERTLVHFPDAVRARAAGLIAKQAELAAAQAARIDELQAVVSQTHGDVRRGRELFFGKASCSLCHQVQGRGAQIGPDLSSIGAIRKPRDLIEAVLVPSASFARGYEPVTLTLHDGRVLNGLMGRETAAEVIIVVVEDGKPVEKHVSRAEIDDAELGRVSVMPEGLERTLTQQELADLFRYLQACQAN
ncbi:MAG: HEAT repeat domain-containing protein [Planctomycetales bacterium]|nr:HEAT repeat domain-containing protein [Planctomycetales bacterium]